MLNINTVQREEYKKSIPEEKDAMYTVGDILKQGL